MTPGRTIKLYRTQHRLSRASISAQSGIPSNVLSDIEADQARLDGAILFDVASALGTDIFTLLGLPVQPCNDRKSARYILRPYLRQMAQERGARLKSRREELGYSVQHVAKEIHKSNAFVGDQERGVTIYMPPDLLDSFSIILQCSPDWILGNVPSQPVPTPPKIEEGPEALPVWRLSPSFRRRDACNRVLAALEASGISETAFREQLGMDDESWRLVQEGRMRFSKESLELISRILSVDLRWLAA